MHFRRVYSVVLLLICYGIANAESPQFGTNPITPKEAARQVGNRVTVRMSVPHTFETPAHAHRLFSVVNPSKSPTGFAVTIPEAALGEFKKVNIDNPATFYKGKTILVVGQVLMPAERPIIIVKIPDSIKVVADSSGKIDPKGKTK